MQTCGVAGATSQHSLIALLALLCRGRAVNRGALDQEAQTQHRWQRIELPSHRHLSLCGLKKWMRYCSSWAASPIYAKSLRDLWLLKDHSPVQQHCVEEQSENKQIMWRSHSVSWPQSKGSWCDPGTTANRVLFPKYSFIYSFLAHAVIYLFLL